ncbi:amidohydrolase family protein [Saliphagus sp. LR7]|uniref:amidohydrolase family protein n=1 Tax=Saliphagus sp. LR7 TaxID=2282654 RepID=UPI000DF74F15|nr:amidohydrolase family protein [Saliphagus sp. LR7]
MRTKDELESLAEEWTMTAAERESFEGTLSDATLYDGHSHVFPIVPNWGPGQTDLDELVEELDAYGVDRAVLLAEEQTEKGFKVPSWWILEQAQRYPDRLIPFCAIEPRMGPDRETMADFIDRYADAGARGFGELKVGLPVDDERMQALYENCEERGLPVLMHISDKHAIDEPGLPGLERMLQRYPDLNFIMHAHGWWAHISAEVTREQMAWYAEGPVEPGGRCDELLAEYDNCYADFSPSGFNAFVRDLEYAQEFLERHHESLVFGTDASYFPEETIPHFAFFDRFDLPAEAWENIRFRNLTSILR